MLRARKYIQNSNPNGSYNPSYAIDDSKHNYRMARFENKLNQRNDRKNKYSKSPKFDGAIYNPNLIDHRFTG